MPEKALSHLTVLDLTHYLAGPYSTKLMAGFGANVIKIEKPITGDRMRRTGPFFRDKEGPERSIPFLWLNTGKRSVTLNLKTESGRVMFKKLVRLADVVVENFSPRIMPSWGLGYNALCDINPRVVMTSISNFGQTGPYKDYVAEEIVEYALSGLMYLTGDPEKPPLCCGPAMAQYTSGMQAYIATLMAIFQRAATGKGQFIDVSIHECALDNAEVCLVEYLHLGKIAKRTGDEHTLVPWKLYPCQDGFAAVIGGPIRKWFHGAELFEEPRLLDQKYRHIGDRMSRRDEVNALIQPWLERNEKKEIYRVGQERGLAFGYLAGAYDILNSPQHEARSYFVEIDHPAVGKHKYCGAPFRPSETPWHSARAPLLGEHNQEIYGELLGYSHTEIRRLNKEGVI